MSNRGEMWVHGNSVIVQYPGGEGLSPFTPGHRMINAPHPDNIRETVPWSDLLGVRSAKGATFKGAFGVPSQHNSNWFHFSIPSPAIFPQLTAGNHLEITVNHISLYYATTDEHVTIEEIAVHDGGINYPVHGIEGTRLYGDHSLVADDRNHWYIDPITMRLGRAHGVLISARVLFDVNGEITFTAAAIHYQVGP